MSTRHLFGSRSSLLATTSLLIALAACAKTTNPSSQRDGGEPGTRDAGAPSRDAGSQRDAGDPDPYALSRNGDAVVEIGSAYTACERAADCMLIGTGCDGCCQQAAIRAELESTYLSNFRAACADYRGGICDCQPQELAAVCRRGVCTAVPEDATGCFSPTQHPERAADPDAHGCPCDLPATVVCIGSSVLICERTERGLSWVARQGDECAPRDPDCSDFGHRRADAQSCIDDFAYCYELDDGEFCGLGCTAELDCAVQDCPLMTTSNEDACVFSLRVHEGMCGAIRYRVEVGGFRGATYYWDLGASALVAMTQGTDTTQYCEGTSFTITYGDESVVRRCEVVLDESTLVCER